MELNNIFTTSEEAGYNHVSIEYCSSATMPRIFRHAAMIQLKSVSECGLLQDFRIVGSTAKVLIETINTFETTGSFATIHMPIAISAMIKVPVSNLVMFLSPLRNPKIKTIKHNTAVANVTNDPTPAFPNTWRAKRIKVTNAHINQLYTCGFVFPFIVSRI